VRARGFLVGAGGRDQVFLQFTASAVHLLSHFTAGHAVMLAQYPCRHVGGAHAHGGELEASAGIFIEGDSACRNLIDGT